MKDQVLDRNNNFADVVKEFREATAFAISVSERLNGEPTSAFGEMASTVHAKMCVNSASTVALCSQQLFDHSAVLSLSRMVVEGMTMFYYLAEQCSPEEEECRRLTLQLHDTVCRIKLLRAWAEKATYDDLLKGRDGLIRDLQVNKFFNGLKAEQQKSILSGEQMFVGGMRAAATRAAGWAEENFISLYNYFSAYTHTAPMSFMRTRTHKVDYRRPSDAQYDIARLALIVAQYCLLKVTLSYLRTSAGAESAFRAEEIAAFEKEVAESTIQIRKSVAER